MTGALRSAEILLVEDEAPLARILSLQLERAGHRCTCAATLAAARERLDAGSFEVLLLDIRLPDGNGLDFLAELKGGPHADLPVVVLTSYAAVDDAVRAIKLGAADYLSKPEGAEQTLVLAERALHAANEADRLAHARQRELLPLERVRLLGESAAAREVQARIARIAGLAQPDAPPPTVLIQGETGAGKGLAARLLHRAGPRADRPFIHVDCASLPRDLFEAELFGHEKGAFTQAHQARPGLIEAAEDGTLFLDEIGEVPLDLQAKLLAVLDRRQVRRVGSTRERPVEAGFLAATNRRLERMVEEGRFRNDLYFRLRVLVLDLPPLRERGEDAVLLAREFLAEAARRHGLAAPRLGPGAEAAITAYPWPGNVRELRHLMERTVLLHPGADLGAAELALPPLAGGGDRADAAAGPGRGEDLDLAAHERALIVEALRRSAGNVSQAARLLGLSRGALRNRLRRHGLEGS
ncbi:MAG: sigma-54-dependent Fis family transcriptional regulator [Planctomycetota bacterium]|nr:MAG: sigma-54-dependent Fis family transcriptional regulator [Planctomycetota bacterium]